MVGLVGPTKCSFSAEPQRSWPLTWQIAPELQPPGAVACHGRDAEMMVGCGTSVLSRLWN